MSAPRAFIVATLFAASLVLGTVVLHSTRQGATPAATPAAACGGCHLVPPANVLPKSAWPDEVARMQAIRAGSEVGAAGPVSALPPDFESALSWYVARAPTALAIPSRWPAASDAGFIRRPLAPPDAPPTPVVSDTALLDVDGDRRLELVVCDMRHGMVLLGRPYDPAAGLTLVAQLRNPARAQVVDLDRDGTRDLIVADLGEFLPRDHDKGAVVWLRGIGGGRFSPFAIGGLPRIADVEAADFDGDGDLDLLVSAFGYRKTGGVLLLDNRTTDWSRPAFSPISIDPRPGAVRALPVDLNRDGRPDVIAAISQEHEQIVAFMNMGAAVGAGASGGMSDVQQPQRGPAQAPTAFRTELLYRAPHPNWGTSGMTLADLDGDGDTDVIVANGDTFDDSLLKPYHGLAWLENAGSFLYHRLADLPGPHSVVAVDLDNDGDLDVVASALIAGGGGEADARLPAIVWLEQTRRRTFVRHTLKMGNPRHAALAAGDYDADGDIDLVSGNMATTGPSDAWVEVWENRKERVPHGAADPARHGGAVR